jgi:hypothetical protein
LLCYLFFGGCRYGPDPRHASRRRPDRITDLDARLRGQELVFFDDGVSHFYNDGRYTYAYDMGAGGYAYGYFEVAEDSTVCIAFVNGFSRCDAFVENNGRLVLITGDGDRFPIREERDAGPDPALE